GAERLCRILHGREADVAAEPKSADVENLVGGELDLLAAVDKAIAEIAGIVAGDGDAIGGQEAEGNDTLGNAADLGIGVAAQLTPCRHTLPEFEPRLVRVGRVQDFAARMIG